MPEGNDTEFSSWLESRRLIITQLANMDRSIQELSRKVDQFKDAAREQTTEHADKAQTAINDLNVRLSVLDMRIKMWALAFGAVAGIAAEIVTGLVTKGLGH